jgi:4-amino-4-deoxy-L-arabinose transferase-like glycosyltransferase
MTAQWMRKGARLDLVVILTLILVAAFFRLYRLQEWPIGLWRDEAANGLEALRVLHGNIHIFYGTREPMFIYLVAASVAIWGRNPFAIRVVAAVAGTITIPVTYLLVREVFRRTDRSARLLAFVTAFWLATSYWHLNFSRLGFRGVLLPLFASLSFYLLWRGWNGLHCDSPRPLTTMIWFAAAGLCFGLTMYTYTPDRLLLLALLPFFAQALWRGFRPRRGAGANVDSLTRAFAPFVVFALVFALTFAPLGAHFLSDPGSFFARSGVSVFSVAEGAPLVTILSENVIRQLGMFGFLGDPNTRHNPAGRPAFDLLTLAFFIVGFLQSLRGWRKMPYLFCLIWFVIMLLPAILTYPELPHSLRAIGALPVAYVFPALGVESTWKRLQASTASLTVRVALSALLALCLVSSATLTFRDYFAPQVEELELVKAFDPRFVEIASLMNELDEPDSVWIVPLGPHEEQRMAYYVIDFLYQGQAPYRYVHLDSAVLAEELTDNCRGARQVLVLSRSEDPLAQPWHELYADSRQLIPFLLDRYGQRLETRYSENVEVLTYRLPEDVAFSFLTDLQPVEVEFGQELRLTGSQYGVGIADPGQVWVALRWQVETTPSADYGVQLALVDQDGEPVAAVNKPLLSAEVQPTSGWEPGQEEVDYYSFAGLPTLALQEYSIEVSVHPMDADGGLGPPIATPDSKASFVLGSVAPSLAPAN